MRYVSLSGLTCFTFCQAEKPDVLPGTIPGLPMPVKRKPCFQAVKKHRIIASVCSIEQFSKSRSRHQMRIDGLTD